MGVLSNLYPVVVVALAAVVLRERIGWRLLVAGGTALAAMILVGTAARS